MERTDFLFKFIILYIHFGCLRSSKSIWCIRWEEKKIRQNEICINTSAIWIGWTKIMKIYANWRIFFLTLKLASKNGTYQLLWKRVHESNYRLKLWNIMCLTLLCFLPFGFECREYKKEKKCGKPFHSMGATMMQIERGRKLINVHLLLKFVELSWRV